MKGIIPAVSLVPIGCHGCYRSSVAGSYKLTGRCLGQHMPGRSSTQGTHQGSVVRWPAAAARLACSWPDDRKPCKCSSCSEETRRSAAALLSRRAGTPAAAAAAMASAPSAEPPGTPGCCCAEGSELLAVLARAQLSCGLPPPAACCEVPQLAALCQLGTPSGGLAASSAPLL